jgi:hypothetical protein
MFRTFILRFLQLVQPLLFLLAFVVPIGFATMSFC